MNKQPLYIIGAGSVGGHFALNMDAYSNEYEIRGFFDDDPDKQSHTMFGYTVLGPVKDALELKSGAVVIGIAFPKIKKQLLRKLSKNTNLVYPSFVHERAWVSKEVSIGRGSIIYPGTCINYGSVIGNFVVLNMNCALGHHTLVGSYSSFAPGVNTGGHTEIEEAVDVGIGVSTVQNIRIGAASRIGGQSMVIQDVEPNLTVAGVPAKPLFKSDRTASVAG